MKGWIYLFGCVLAAALSAHGQSSRPGWGATPYAGTGGTGVTFRTWAPNASSVHVAGAFNGWSMTSLPLTSEGNGVWSRDVTAASPGQPYKFVLNGSLWRRDPYSRQLEGSGTRNSLIHQPAAFNWGTNTFAMAPAHELVIYEMHIGAFHDPVPGDGQPGRFTNAIQKLDHLVDLGINAVELMPISEFPTSTSWGYNLSYPFAIESTYGTPDQFKAFVKACHERGIAVLMDVVHNHWGSDNDDWSLWQYDGWSTNGNGGIYFFNEPAYCCTWWGPRPDYRRPEVRAYILDNFRMWKQDYRIDGFRWDAPQFMLYNDNTRTVVIPDASNLIHTVISTLSNEFERTFHIAEDIKGVIGFNSHWDMSYQGTMQGIMSTGNDNDRNMSTLAGAINSDPQRIIYSESHDSTGDLNSWAIRFPNAVDATAPEGYYARKRSTLAALFTLTAPGTPMLWMGQEMLETNLFSDARALDWSRTNTFAHVTRLYRDLIHLRRNLDGVSGGLAGPGTGLVFLDQALKTIGYRRYDPATPDQDVLVIANLRNTPRLGYTIPMPEAGTWYIHVNTDLQKYGEDYEDVGDTPSITASGNPPTAMINLGRYSALVLSRLPMNGLAVDSLAVDDTTLGNGNGRIDPGESILITPTLRNRGQFAYAPVAVTLAAPDPTIAINQPFASVPMLAADTSAATDVALMLTVPTNWTCGTPLEIDLALEAGDVALNQRRTLAVGAVAAGDVVTNTIASADVPQPIIDNQSVFSDLVVTNTQIGDLTAIRPWIRLNHTWNSDLVIALQHPDGTEVVLANRRGGSRDNFGSGTCGVNVVYTVFDMTATTNIGANTQNAPFAGRYAPDGDLAAFAGKPAAGTWRLRVTDLFTTDQGTLLCWGLDLEANAETAECTTFTGVVLDADGDGIPDWWEASYSGSATGLIATADDDGDGFSNLDEFKAATHPGDPASFLRADTVPIHDAGQPFTLRWNSAADRTYRLWFRETLGDGAFTPVASNIPAAPPVNTWTDPDATNAHGFYRIEVE